MTTREAAVAELKDIAEKFEFELEKLRAIDEKSYELWMNLLGECCDEEGLRELREMFLGAQNSAEKDSAEKKGFK